MTPSMFHLCRCFHNCPKISLSFNLLKVSPHLQPARVESGHNGLVHGGEVGGDLVPVKIYFERWIATWILWQIRVVKTFLI